MIRLVILGVTLATTALAGYFAKRKFTKMLAEPPNFLDPMPPPCRQTTRTARNRRQPIHPSDNGDTTSIPLP